MNSFFNNTKDAFSLKSNLDLLRARLLFTIIQNKFLVRLGTWVTNFCLKIHLPINSIIKVSIYKHFCGGIKETECYPIIKNMFKKNVCTVLDFSTEGYQNEKDFEICCEKKISIIEFIKDKNEIPFAVFKPSSVGKSSVFEKVSKGTILNTDEKEAWLKIRNRFHLICKKAKESDVKILIDAEEFLIQNAIDQLALEMMIEYNKNDIFIYNTVQMYRKDRLTYLKKITTENPGVLFGFKLVRGAYMEKERHLSKKHDYPSPICKDKLSTDKNFDSAIEYVFQNLKQINLVCASHNEASTLKVMDLMNKNNLKNNDKKVWFGQLYGMSDNITFNLAMKSYNTFKILPFGPVRNLIPYLLRRAEENTSVIGQSGRELSLIKSEIRRRRLQS